MDVFGLATYLPAQTPDVMEFIPMQVRPVDVVHTRQIDCAGADDPDGDAEGCHAAPLHS